MPRRFKFQEKNHYIMNLKSMEPFGLALEEFYNGNKQAKVIFHRDDGLKDDYFVSQCFRSEKDFSTIERQAVDLCYGRVLDVGAGVGPHSLELQKMGLEVCALDISPQACDIMEKRGVKNVECTDVYEIDEKNFDTILLMGRAIGFAEDLSGLKKFLEFCKVLLNPKGQILLDYLDVRSTTDPDHLAYQEKSRQLGRYIGVIGLQMEYKGSFGEKFKLLHVDPGTLIKCAQETGWICNILKNENGNYLAKIFK
ncbi:MAG: class I SAM-dependent methyltransferase [Promethearchaeota archaeon]